MKVISRVGVVLVLAIMFLLPQRMSATHVAGGDLSYECLGNNMYKIILEFRRDCFNGAVNAQFDDPASLGIYDIHGNLQAQLGRGGQLLIEFTDQDTLNEVLTSECNVEGEDVCIHRTTYVDTIMLPDNPDGYIISYQRCCRNASLSNIIDPLLTGATYWTHITSEAMDLCNSSPKFKDWPPIYLCADEMTTFDHGAIDTDGDSLVYKLCLPNSGASEPFPNPQPSGPPPYPYVSYGAPYNVNNMMGTADLTIDPETGLLTVNPGIIGQFLIGVCVEEYRNGELLSTIRRDFEFNVRICNKFVSADFSVEPNPNCNNLSVTFKNESDRGEYKWYFDYPDTTQTSTDRNPNYGYSEPGLYEVVLITTSGECSDSLHRMIGVSVPGDPSGSWDFDVEYCSGVAQLSLSGGADTDQDVTSWEWSVEANGSTEMYDGQDVSFDYNGNDDELEVTLVVVTESGCTDEITQTIALEARGDVDIDFDMVTYGCDGEIIIELSGFANGNTQVEDWTWEITDSEDAFMTTGQNTTYTYTGDEEVLEVSLLIIDEMGCTQRITKDIDVSEIEFSTVDFTYVLLGCTDDIEIELVANTDPSANVTNWTWTVEDGQNVFTYSGINPTFTYQDGASSLTVILEVEIDGKCTERYEEEINTELLEIAFIDDEISVCEGGSSLILANPNPTWNYTFSPDTYLDLSDPSNPLVIPLQDISYTVTATNGVCEISSVIDVKLYTPNVDILSSAVILCNGESTPLIQNGDPSLEYIWSPTTGLDLSDPANPIASPTSDIVYSVTVRDGECVAMDQISITVDSPSVDLISEAITLCEGSSTQLTLNANPSYEYTWSPTTGLDLSDPTNPIASPASDIVYSVTVRDGDCEVVDQISITVGSPSIDLISETITLCEGSSTHLTVNANPSYDYTWSPTIGLDLSDPANPVASPSSDITYSVTVRDGTCEKVEQISVRVDNPSVNLISDQIILCNGSSTPLIENANPHFEYIWSPTTGLDLSDPSNPIASPSSDITYSVTVRDGACEVVDQVEIKLFRPEIDVVANQLTLCNGESTALIRNGNSGLQYVWSPTIGLDLTDPSNPIASPDSDIVYTVTAIDGTCEVTDQIEVRVFNPSVELINDEISICPGGGTYLIQNGNPEFDYIWTPTTGLNLVDPSNPIASPETDMTYTVTVRDGSCEITEQVDIKISDSRIVDIIGDEFACNGSITLQANVAPGEIVEWFTDPNYINSLGRANPITIPVDGQVTVHVLSNGGSCGGTGSRTIQEADFGIQLDVESGVEVCQSEFLQINASAFGSSQDITYDWAPMHIIESGHGTSRPVFEFETAGVYTITYSAMSGQGCSDSGSIQVHVLEVPEVSLQEIITVCNNGALSLNPSYNPDYIYEWSSPIPGLITDPLSNNPTVVVTQPGIVDVRITKRGQGQCAIERSIELRTFEDFEVALSTDKDVVCEGDIATLRVEMEDDVEVVWIDNQGNEVGYGKIITAAPTVNQTYTATIVSAQGCEAQATINVDIAPDFTLEVDSGDGEFCFGQQLSATASTNVNAFIEWSDQTGRVLSNNSRYDFVAESATTLFVTATDNYGCTQVTSLAFNPVSFDAELVADSYLVCQGDVAIIDIEGLDPEQTYDIQWEQDESILTDLSGRGITVEPSSSTVYTVMITNAEGCAITLSTGIEVATFGEDLEIQAEATTILPGQTVQLTSSLGPGFTYEWNPAAFVSDPSVYNPIAFPPNEMTRYSVTVTDINGCTAEAEIVITQQNPECNLDDIFVPNMFTPNGDGVNDLFRVESNYIDDLEMIIYNRWGQEVFKSQSQDDCWDGTFGSTQVDPDVYGYYLKVSCMNGTEVIKQGNVTIVK